MAAHRYVCVDESSNYTAGWMIYYTHNSEMAAHRYVYEDVSSERLVH
jgi:hypothetical protein